MCLSTRGAVAATLAVALCAASPVLAQNAPMPPTQRPSAAAQMQGMAPDRLSAMPIELLVAPCARAPPDALGVVFDAACYPAALRDAADWLRRPAAERGPARDTWPPSARRLAERAPQAVGYLTNDMRRTATLGAAYQNPPNDVWLRRPRRMIWKQDR